MAKGKKTEGRKKTKRAKANGSGNKGHNGVVRVNRKDTKVFFDRLDAAHDRKASRAAEDAADIGALYERAANALGVSQKAVKATYAKHKFLRAHRAKHDAMQQEDQDMADKLELALGSYASTPLGQAAVERRDIEQAAAEMDEASAQQ